MSNHPSPRDPVRHVRQTRAAHGAEKRLLIAAVYQPILSVAEARRAAKHHETCLLWIDESEAAQFREPGWEELQPHRQGAALFINRYRGSRSVPSRALLRKRAAPD